MSNWDAIHHNAKLRQERVLALRRSGKSMREIGATLGVSPSRAGQIHADALRRGVPANRLAPAEITRETPIDALPLSLRTINVLLNDNRRTVGDLLTQDREELLTALLRIPNGNRSAVLEIHALLNRVEPVTTRSYEPRSRGFRARTGKIWAGPWRSTKEAAIDDAVEAGAAVRAGKDNAPFFAVGCKIVQGLMDRQPA